MDISNMTYTEIDEKVNQLDRLGNSNEACARFHQALDMAMDSKDDAYVPFFQAKIVIHEGEDYDKAYELYRQALKCAPEDPLILKNIGIALSHLYRDEEAIEYYNKALEIKPDDVGILRRKGVSVSFAHGEDEGNKLFDKALKLKPDDVETLYHIATSFIKLDQDEKAIEFFDKALSINPNDWKSLRGKGTALCKLGQYQEANENIERALEINPNDANIWKWKSIIFVESCFCGEESYTLQMDEEFYDSTEEEKEFDIKEWFYLLEHRASQWKLWRQTVKFCQDSWKYLKPRRRVK
jgi:tetratricopeptide (TPR) repeat protein